MKNILVPVGSSENGINNLKYAINFASISGATVYLIKINKVGDYLFFFGRLLII